MQVYIKTSLKGVSRDVGTFLRYFDLKFLFYYLCLYLLNLITKKI